MGECRATTKLKSYILTNQHLIECIIRYLFFLNYIMFYTQAKSVTNMAINYYSQSMFARSRLRCGIGLLGTPQ